jgi:hypothetical protein
VKPRSLGNKPDETQRQEVGLVDDLVQSEHFGLVEVGPVKELNHLGDDRASEIAGAVSFRPPPRAAWRSRCSAFRATAEALFVDGQVTGKTQSDVRRRWLVLERVEALVGQRGPRGFDSR